jgi:hypothetical protein
MSADQRLIELAQKVQVIQTNRAEDLPAALVEVTSAAASGIPGAAYAGITLLTTRDAGVASRLRRTSTPSCSTKYRKGIVKDRVCTPLDKVRLSW